jgi:glycosyltransferase involved in cell wall biosynthesis
VSALRVGLNLLFLGEASGGVGRYACELTGALASRKDLALEILATRDGIPVMRRESWWGSVPVRVVPIRRSDRVRYLAASLSGASAWALKRRLDVLHSPANVGPVASPGVANVITVHDLIWHHAGLDWGTKEAIHAIRRASELSLPRGDRIIAISDWAAQDLKSVFSIEPERISVVMQGVRGPRVLPESREISAFRTRLGIQSEARVVLCVAQKRPYKRQDVLVRALANLSSDVVLVLPGAASDWEHRLRQLSSDLGVSDRVVFPEWISDADLEILYAMATLVALPSRFEGFGLPALEAMARGVPVACSNRAALPEVVGPAAAVFDPDDADGVSSVLRKALEDESLRAQMREAGHRRAAEFSWERTADRTAAVYRDAAVAHRARRLLR